MSRNLATFILCINGFMYAIMLFGATQSGRVIDPAAVVFAILMFAANLIAAVLVSTGE